MLDRKPNQTRLAAALLVAAALAVSPSGRADPADPPNAPANPPANAPGEPGADGTGAPPKANNPAKPVETGATAEGGAPAPRKPRVAPVAAAAAPVIAGAPLPPGGPADPNLAVHEILLGDLGPGGDFDFNGIFDKQGPLNFGVPIWWKLEGDAELHLRLARAPHLLTDISHITVYLDGHPVGSVRLDGTPDEPWWRVLKFPVRGRTGFHQLEFRAYHRTRLPCEPAELPGMWSRILAESFLRLRSRPIAPPRSLADWPFPFRDELDPDVRRVVIALREAPSVEEVQAAAYISSWLGHAAPWRPLELILHRGPIAEAPPGQVIVVMRADAGDPRLAEVMEQSKIAGDPALAPLGAMAEGKEPWPAAGALGLWGRPGTDGVDSVLAVIGKDGAGIVSLGVLLSGRETASLSTGTFAAIDAVKANSPMEPRRWKRTVPPEETFTLADLGLRDLAVQGPSRATARIKLPLIPDDKPVAGKVRLRLRYSYAAQVDPDRSRLDVVLNGIEAGGAALSRLDGQNRATLELELPAHEFGPESEMEVRFNLVPRARPTCLGEHYTMLWGTVHSDSEITMPRERWVALPDMWLLHYGGFPFGEVADLSGTRMVVAATPSATELQMLIWLAGEFGRAARGDRFNYRVSLGAQGIARNSGENLVVVEGNPQGQLLRDLGLLEFMSFSPESARKVKIALGSGGAVEMGPNPRVAYVQELHFDGPPASHALIAFAVESELFKRVGRCLTEGALFDRLRGQMARIGSCDDIATVTEAEKKVLGRKPMGEAAYEPFRAHYWPIIAGGVAAIGLALILRGLWIQRRRRTVQGEA